MKRLLVAFTLVFATVAGAQQQPKAEVLVLGTYHMANRGQDIYNMQADDVLSPRRQAEIAQVIEVLKRFKPTKIAVEADLLSPGNPVTRLRPNQYAEYLAGQRELGRDEVEQLGFRLAKELGLKTIYPVNADYDFPYPRLVNYAKAAGRSQQLEEIMSGFGEKSKQQGEYLGSHTILETLLWMNADERAEYEQGLYLRLAHFGEVGDWAGADLLSDWFRRNARIYTNLMGLVESPNERILVIYGSGHLAWLRYDCASDPTIRLRKLAEFLK